MAIRATKADRLKNIVVFYHASCSDGFGAAWAAKKKFGTRASYVPISHTDKPPKGLRRKEIYFIDIVWPRSVMRRLIRDNLRVTAIDHHITAKEIVEETAQCSYDIGHSGAMLAWRYFHPGKRPPLLLQYVEDQDLWNFRLPGTRALNAYIELFEYDFSVWNKLAKDLETRTTRKRYVDIGSCVLRHIERTVAHIRDEAERVKFGGYVCWAVNSSVFRSEIGGALSKQGKSPSLIWSYKQGEIRVSLRSDGKVNVAELAKRFGGGGHKAAAGFRLDAAKKLPWRRI